MIIGILTYFNVCNFGANLQALSTFNYFLSRGYNPIMIDWMPLELEMHYKKTNHVKQQEVHSEFVSKYLKVSQRCRTAKDVADVIEQFGIKAVIVGSDAVVQHHTLLSRLIFPTSSLFSIVKASEDTTCPNPFWGTFNEYLKTPVPIAMMSVSNQNSNFKAMTKKERSIMKEYASRICYISTRDKRTSDMFKLVTDSAIIPPITPDPVFAFNENVKKEQFSEEEIRDKFGLKKNYILLCFHASKNVDKEWLRQFSNHATRKGFECVAFPVPGGISFEHPFEKEINVPLKPMEWYSLIKYSSGYVGCNMHPIVVCLHNAVPCYSFDNYGVSHFRAFIENKSSKIYHILNEFNHLNNRARSRGLCQEKPSPEYVLDKLISFDRIGVRNKAKEYVDRYYKMMLDIEKSIQI